MSTCFLRIKFPVSTKLPFLFWFKTALSIIILFSTWVKGRSWRLRRGEWGRKKLRRNSQRCLKYVACSSDWPCFSSLIYLFAWCDALFGGLISAGVQGAYIFYKMGVQVFPLPYELLYSCGLYMLSNTKAFYLCSKAVAMFENDERFKAVERVRDREDLFDNYMVELERKVYIFL